jgi:AraC-like DNA-binding protein
MPCSAARLQLKQVNESYQSQVLGERFHLERAPTLLARTASITPVGFTRLTSDRAAAEPAAKVPVEKAYAFHVALRPTATDLWIDGKHHSAVSISPGATFLFDLSSDPISHIHQPFDILRFYISRAFRRTTRVTPHQWLIRKRVERAQELLLRGRIGLAEVAVVCGFVDQSHLSRVFARFAGVSPGRWRQQNGSRHQR